jgi:hypothetical protein
LSLQQDISWLNQVYHLPANTILRFSVLFNSGFWLVAILGFGSRYLSFNNRMLKYTNEAVLPFYIIHQTVIVTIGFYIAYWDASVAVKYLIIITSSFAVIAFMYDLVIRRVKWLRFLFGMRLTKRLPGVRQITAAAGGKSYENKTFPLIKIAIDPGLRAYPDTSEPDL